MGGDVHAVAVTRDGRRIVSRADDRTVKIFDITTGDCLMTLPHTAYVRSVCV
eukprot:NODE_8795_length_237_cov_77.590426_g8180_i0.p1 GENE.NODE_8795_length_237_cov_77.590426_g8180_i0~~NODE_8795_length_237_cov_77.590426_g8180_i0.p1  ORF type:complete len:60 (+),score=23.16 NODE_8795_length_237_cov_77.590426_g8180_i0:27-182(+)